MNIEIFLDIIIYTSFLCIGFFIGLFFFIENNTINYKWYPEDIGQDFKLSINTNWQEGDEPIHDFEKKQFSN